MCLLVFGFDCLLCVVCCVYEDKIGLVIGQFFEYTCYSSASRGVLGVSGPPRQWRGVLDPPVSVANTTVKDTVYKPTSEPVPPPPPPVRKLSDMTMTDRDPPANKLVGDFQKDCFLKDGLAKYDVSAG